MHMSSEFMATDSSSLSGPFFPLEKSEWETSVHIFYIEKSEQDDGGFKREKKMRKKRL